MNNHKSADATSWTLECLVRLEEHIQKRLSGRLLDFRLFLCGDAVVLRGNAPSYYVKQLAQHAVMQGTPRPIRANEIEVSSPS